MTGFRLDEIEVDQRARTEMRNIDSLARSIETKGLLHPPVVRRRGERWVLVAGARRLAALRLLGRSSCDVTVVHTLDDELAALQAEGEENTEREPFTPSEAVRHAERIEVVVAAQAADEQARTQAQNRQRDERGRITGSANLAAPARPAAERETRVQVAKATGYGRTTLAKAREVVQAAEDPATPEPVREVAKQAVAEMDRSGKVDGAHKKVEAASAWAALLAEFPPAAEIPERFHREALAGFDALNRMDSVERDRRADTFRKWLVSRTPAVAASNDRRDLAAKAEKAADQVERLLADLLVAANDLAVRWGDLDDPDAVWRRIGPLLADAAARVGSVASNSHAPKLRRIQ